MKKVYVAVNDCVIDYESCPLNPKVFKDREAAREYIKKEFETFLKIGYHWDQQEQCEDSCEVWTDGDYSCNHWSMKIVECEIK
jgi:hypothetical protein